MIWESPRSIPNKRAQHSTSKALQPCWRNHTCSPERHSLGRLLLPFCSLTQPVREEPPDAGDDEQEHFQSRGVAPNGRHSSKSTSTEKGFIPTREGPGGFPHCVVGAVICCMVLSRVKLIPQPCRKQAHLPTQDMGQPQHAGRAQGEGWSPLNSRQGTVSPGAWRLIQ